MGLVWVFWLVVVFPWLTLLHPSAFMKTEAQSGILLSLHGQCGTINCGWLCRSFHTNFHIIPPLPSQFKLSPI